MIKYAKAVEGIVLDYQVFPDSFRLENLMNPVILDGYQECPEEVDLGWFFDGETYSPPKSKVSVEDIVKDFEARIQRRLDDFARTLTYDGMLSACTYATSQIEMYRIEGQYCVEARDATWAKAFDLISAFDLAGMEQGPLPTWEDIEAQLPPLAWPEGSRGYHLR